MTEPSGCGPTCPYRSMYEGTQSSLMSMTGKHQANLERVQKLRSGIIRSMKANHPRCFSELETEIGSQMRNNDDRILLLALEQMFERTRTPHTDLSELRHELESHGYALPAEDDPAAWAAVLSSQRRPDTTVTPDTPELAVSVRESSVSDPRFPALQHEPRVLVSDDPAPDPGADEIVTFLPPSVADWPTSRSATDFPDFQESVPSEQDTVSPPAVVDTAGGVFDDLFSEEMPAPAGEVDVFDDLFSEEDPHVISAQSDAEQPGTSDTEEDFFADLFSYGLDADPAIESDTSSIEDLFFGDDPPGDGAEEQSTEPSASVNADAGHETASSQTVPSSTPDTAAPAVLRPSLAPATTKSPAGTSKRRRNPTVQATKAQPAVVKTVDLTVSERRELDTLLALPKPVFLSDIAAVLGAERADEWFAWVKSDRKSGLRFLNSKARWNDGPLIIPATDARSPLQLADTSGWLHILDTYRGSHLYAAAQMMRTLGEDIIHTDVQSHTFAMTVRSADGVYGLIGAVGEDFSAGSGVSEQIGVMMQMLLKSRLTHILVVTTSGQKRTFAALSGFLMDYCSVKRPRVQVMVAYAHLVGRDGATLTEVWTP